MEAAERVRVTHHFYWVASDSSDAGTYGSCYSELYFHPGSISPNSPGQRASVGVRMTRSASELERVYPEGCQVETIVDHVEPFGVFVRLGADPDVVGLIRPREWSWGRSPLNLEAEVKPGDRIDAVVLRHGRQGMDLSRRQTLPSPYPVFCRRHGVGGVVEGRVYTRKQTGVEVLLDGNVDGFIPRAEIPDYGQYQDGFGLLTGDCIQARILRFEDKREIVILSVRELLRRRHRSRRERVAGERLTLRDHPSLGPALENISLTLQLQNLEVPDVSSELRKALGRILVVEDHDGVNESLGQYLTLLGLACDIARSVEAGRTLVAEQSHGLVILDVNFPGGKGVELVDDLAGQLAPPLILVVTAASETDWARLIAEHGDKVHGIFRKPTQVARILAFVESVLAGGKPADDRTSETGFDTSHIDISGSGMHLGAKGRERIALRIEDLRRTANADRVFVVGYQPGPRFALIAGTLPPITQDVEQKLEISPVGDVIRRFEAIVIQQVSRHSAQFRHLLEVLPLQSFAAEPIPYRDRSEYGLFLTGNREDQLTVRHEELRRVAHEIAQWLAEERLNEVITENQTLLATGFLADSLLHEIRNSTEALSHSSEVQALLTHKYANNLGEMSQNEVVEFKKTVLRIRRDTGELKQVIELFRNLAGQTAVEEIELDDIVQRLVRAVTPLADERGVTIDTEFGQNIPPLRIVPRLLEHPLLNIMINAVEQMALAGGSDRVLHVSTHLRDHDSFPVAISISDDGPGIHQVHAERIFELFFTTKPRGSGLGLYLSRNLVERLGGRIRVVRSVMFVGTEFSIELPRSVLA
jgi:signal transduction histidine kinase/CheY-like chemotaxis protein/predicted RNA-binding protein with RPS1 domain